MDPSMQEQIAAHQQTVLDLSQRVPLLEQIADRIIACFDAGGKLLIVGNGGSAADAQHIAGELVGRFKHMRKALPAVAITTDTSVITAIVNDIGIEAMFARQIEALARPGDVVWALSVSGRSPNILSALASARQAGAYLIGFTGQGGDALADACDLAFRSDHVSSDRVQEIHLLAYHLICERIERHYVA